MTMVLFRQVPVASPIHSLWAGTKMIAAFLLSLVLMFWPTWLVLGAVIVFLLVIGVVARLPLNTLPRLPLVFWVLIAIGALLNAPVGSQSVLNYCRILVFGLVLVTASFLIAWTTPMGEIAPALAKLGAPLRKLRLPVDEWAVVVALMLRSLPLLLEEIRILRAARKLRPKDRLLERAADAALIDILTAAMAVATRRASELGEAITARGGTGQLTAHPSSPTRRDAVALAVVVAVCLGSVALDWVI
ncbi:energy-coupling factor transporter transmembrane protein EcfT [Nocardia sp. XZ_19_385]|uniref:energy-coupling factor transporter transmembrane component T family protein n=1 Tax=Nocardia sp. XZ_19_385 TaxID=2769488 RepID=UPI00188FC13D|nr:energy-coupling factor transporter transmembrane protein EcfT [Nocardia sp. XZ_19_385]